MFPARRPRLFCEKESCTLCTVGKALCIVAATALVTFGVWCLVWEMVG